MMHLPRRDGHAACIISYAVMTEFLNVAVAGRADPVGGMWAAVSTAFVFRDSRQHSLTAGAGRLIATCVSFALCLPYLWLIPANVAGMPYFWRWECL
jgi:hypothetical protein